MEPHVAQLVGQGRAQAPLPARTGAQGAGDAHPRALAGEEVGHALRVRPLGRQVGVEVEVGRLLLDQDVEIVCAQGVGDRPPAPAKEAGDEGLALLVDLLRPEVGPQGDAPRRVTHPAHLPVPPALRAGPAAGRAVLRVARAPRSVRRKAWKAAVTRSGLSATPPRRRRSAGSCPATKQRYSASRPSWAPNCAAWPRPAGCADHARGRSGTGARWGSVLLADARASSFWLTPAARRAPAITCPNVLPVLPVTVSRPLTRDLPIR